MSYNQCLTPKHKMIPLTLLSKEDIETSSSASSETMKSRLKNKLTAPETKSLEAFGREFSFEISEAVKVRS